MKKIMSFILALMLVMGLTGCSAKGNGDDSSKDVSTNVLVEKVKENIEMRNTAKVNDDLAEMQYYINPDDVEEFTIENGTMNTGLEFLAVVKAKEGKVEEVKESLEKVISDKKASAFYPGEAESIAGAKVDATGDYVMLFIIPDYDETGKDYSAEAVEIVKEALK